MAALLMVLTLPGRTHGLGLITEPLISDLRLDRVDFATINLWATLLGAAFCLPCGWLIDRLGARTVLLATTLGLGASVVAMAQVGPGLGEWLLPGFFALLLLTRGLGQSALSVVSLALMGRSVGRRSGVGVGVYSLLTAMGFMAAFGMIKHLLEANHLGWRPLWADIGLAVAALGSLAFVLVGPPVDRGAATAAGGDFRRDPCNDGAGLTLYQALQTPAFWVFASGTSLYGLIVAGLSLFNQSILAERGFDRGVFLTITMLSPVVGLAANLGTGWLAERVPQGRLLAGAMWLLMTALLAFPFVHSLSQVYLYAVALGIAGGMVTVIFFGIWGQAFGTAHLGKIQGAAQMLTVLASAAGPLLLAAGQRAAGSYVPVFQKAAVAAGLLAVAAWLVPLPRRAAGPAWQRTTE
jgi:MFS family permease